MVVFLLLLFGSIDAFDIQSIIHNADTHQLKCDSLPYRTLYFDRTCFFTIIQTEKSCSEIVPGSKLTKPSAEIAQMMYLEISDFQQIDDASGPKKIALCSYDRPIKCPTGESIEQLGLKCVIKSPEKMTYPDAVEFCASQGLELPVVKNRIEKQRLFELVKSNTIWLDVTASRKGWSDNSQYSWHTTCAVNNFKPPNERATFCDAQYAEVFNKETYTSVREQSSSNSVVCDSDAGSEFWTPPEPKTPPIKPKTTTTTENPQKSLCLHDIKGVWSDWVTIGPCATTCGSCSVAKRKRVCNRVCNCDCEGVAEDIGPCGIAMCPFPTKTCCFEYRKSLNYQTSEFFCGSHNRPRDPIYNTRDCSYENPPSPVTQKPVQPVQPVQDKPICKKDGEGRWSEWVTTGSCATTCGSCSVAKRKRVCNTTCGCECKGLAEDIGPCGIAMCLFPSKTCCSPYVKSLNYRVPEFFCGDHSPQHYPPNCAAIPAIAKHPQPTSCWSSWSEWVGNCEKDPSSTNPSIPRNSAGPCGWCGKHTRTRTRKSSPCNGETTQTEPCGSRKLCTFPTKTCCAPYIKSLINNTLICG